MTVAMLVTWKKVPTAEETNFIRDSCISSGVMSAARHIPNLSSRTVTEMHEKTGRFPLFHQATVDKAVSFHGSKELDAKRCIKASSFLL